MYSREEASRIREEFWTVFGQYLSPYRSVAGEKVNWVNYKTGIKHIYFRMQATKRDAFISIDVAHPDTGIQELFFEQFLEYQQIFNDIMGEEWIWKLHTTDEYGKTISRIYKEIEHVNIFDKKDWPQLISFFKPRILALDNFWYDVKDTFDALK